MSQQYLKIKGEKVVQAFVACKQCKTTSTATVRHNVHICGVYIGFASYITIEQVIEMNRCNSYLRVLLSEVMAAVWINGFVNGQEATVYSVSIYISANASKSLKKTAARKGEKIY